MSERKKFKITYSTLSTDDPLLNQYYDEAVAEARKGMGQTFDSIYINGRYRAAEKTFSKVSPVDLSLTMGHFQYGSAVDMDEAIAAAKAAWEGWRKTPWQERVALLRKAADNISDRLFEMSAILSLEVGKNRLEALGDVEETADLIRYCCDGMEKNGGFIRQMNNESDRHHNRSVLKPHGVWGVISPFNFPSALSGGPVGGALVTGNTVVLKPAEDSPYTNYLLSQCFHDAGLPAGVFNMVTGDEVAGKAMVANPDMAGITFTGSSQVGRHIISSFASQGAYARPVVAEMGGKNPTIITENADLDKAALGVMRSAFGLTGQKCSACSRVFVHETVKDTFVEKLVNLAKGIKVGDPTVKENYMGPIINKAAYEAYQRYAADLHANAKVLVGGKTLDESGYYVAPTVAVDLPEGHALWKQEMFAPIVTIAGFTDKDAAMVKANDVDYGLTAGFFSEDEEEVNWFLDHIQAGVLYVNRSSGATTGAWPGYQAFGGWKGSTATSKAAGSHYYLQQYMREQSHTIVS